MEKLQATTQKSYYNKAKFWQDENGVFWLKSYETIVAKIENGKLIKLWDGYSKTTLHHIYDFCNMLNINFSGSKKDWLALPCENGKKERFCVKFSNGFIEWKSQVLFDNEDDAYEFGDAICQKRHYTIGFLIEQV